ncbi:MAG TPA: DUF6250 domain-containing protein [Steroidobacteraceae bacterium]|nr:DUF6250 domain-containing protein [Steroidobacteraceae bacterium]
MSSTAFSRTSIRAALAAASLFLTACATAGADRLLFSDDFRHGLGQWHIEAERPARIEARDGVLDIDSPAGVTLWFDHRIDGPVRIEFEAVAVAEGGPNDQVSDLNVFWMARNPDGTEPVHSHRRTGRFADYNDLLTYYVGLGGNRNTTTRFRRYVGDPVNRPMLPEHDLGGADTLLTPNAAQTITLIANGHFIEYRRDGRTLFALEDGAPYERGWFALRTTYSHLRVRNLRIHRLASDAGANR